MALANAVAGATRPSQQITWTDEDGTAFNLTGATITGKIKNNATGTTVSIAGVLTVTDAANGVFTWDYDTTDVATTGHYTVQFTAAFASNPTPARTLAASWVVREALT